MLLWKRWRGFWVSLSERRQQDVAAPSEYERERSEDKSLISLLTSTSRDQFSPARLKKLDFGVFSVFVTYASLRETKTVGQQIRT